ncbi:histidine phosphatase family protein [Actinacidiphila sp. ITFR-21]|uniref:histidine phosphatase family protein n=1 Tax=Actinacidiphila sp. ITFR-21 TaxID=3075199 RepID=UPI00288B44D2|nr:histidine phosphatase family protein [Streptomyces sp. ITFR-21]WNI18807.1 histidine phosphatase family protein [Streptomyces sp. ITFR-21]
MRLYLVRHGENPANVHHILSYRKADFRLTAHGVGQAEGMGRLLRALPGVGDAAWWSSPLRRARHTAELLAPPGTAVRVVEALRELDVGDLDGSGRPDARAAYDRVIGAWRAGSARTGFPGGESHTEATARLAGALRAVVSEPGAGAAVVVGHGGLFTEGLRALLGPGDRGRFDRASEPRWLNCEAAEVSACALPGGQLELAFAAWHSTSRTPPRGLVREP